MTMQFYPIIGISGKHKSVVLLHTNKYLSNFHYTLDNDIRKIYDNWPAGEYTFIAGYQNGYYELGISHVIVEITEP